MYNDYFVTPQWLNAHLFDGNIIVLDASSPPPTAPYDCRQRYLEEHIPNAQFFHQDEIADKSCDLPHMLPSAEVFSHAVGMMGIGNETQVIIYSQNNLFSSPRAWWTFTTMGCNNIKILAGGIDAWKAAGFTVQSGEVPPPETKKFTASRKDSNALNQQQVLDIVHDGKIQIIDARATARFLAQAPEPRPGLRMGHIPGSKNVPWDLLVENGMFKSPEQLKAIFNEQGVDINAPSMTTCGSGMTAAVVLMALTLLGNHNVRLYDGSWAQWGQDNGLPIEP
ncbi:3-mercaptopyruvate sulfurtransferase [Providencia rettgeri]|uniref:3-mercaptopyruvate sulfurtransferase n=1 Tax=Providencia TaxID=586 RepID=UPI0018E856BD|nr:MULTISPECIES: 3-mercaptopyruvate sulfurtransferase [Providencia]ELR5227206.1 3-mercaptopyruvate sulfurtransferase [Providencia rettgeri]ELR5254129.1 3-mercaptopyruvate sulfurtransferase [Providencia rettgeri]QQE94302.1 3-mercaptopyruvate sulfurtransferase [Providencia rettgeri]QWJ92768.1 3-mercaptopyruvate sulfurtransferase [Providencia rettgeri]